MLAAANKIFAYTDGFSYEQFIADEKTIDATIRNFEIIGEAASRIPADFKLAHPEIDWQGITGVRNRVIHEYFGVDYEILWRIKDEFLAGLTEWIKLILTTDYDIIR